MNRKVAALKKEVDALRVTAGKETSENKQPEPPIIIETGNRYYATGKRGALQTPFLNPKVQGKCPVCHAAINFL